METARHVRATQLDVEPRVGLCRVRRHGAAAVQSNGRHSADGRRHRHERQLLRAAAALQINGKNDLHSGGLLLLFRLQWRSARSHCYCSVYIGGLCAHCAVVPFIVEVYTLILLLFRLHWRSTRSLCCSSVYSGGLHAHTTVVPFTVEVYALTLLLFRLQWRTPWRYFLDHAFGRAIVESLVVTAWRGIWNFYSDVIFPRDPLVSSVVNLLGAIALVVALLLAERPAGRLARHLAINGQRVVRLTFESAYILLALAAVVGYWRGWWLLLEENILPQAVLGPWLCHAIGYVALALTIASDSLTQRSVILNGETNSEVHWEIEYMSVLLGRKHAMHQQVET